ncbi:hypothetical protein SAMN06295967_1119 [Belliella buryatensis]|uniref:Uncharacterized protein n=1 Tax=Belliella buryatensis TaxID=1500549 RepID=A0A239EYF5_9BACT|nr:hypothetical protein SAMN06295967_1119 [Belliella buryatensis]
MLTINGQHILYPLISLASIALAYAGHGLLEAQEAKAKSPTANTAIINLFIDLLFITVFKYVYFSEEYKINSALSCNL